MAKREKIEPKVYVADFETTVYSDEDLEKLGLKEQTQTEVWSAAITECELEPSPDRVSVYNNIYEFMNHIERLENNSIVYFHNLRFDASYLIDFLEASGYVPVIDIDSLADEDENDWLDEGDDDYV